MIQTSPQQIFFTLTETGPEKYEEGNFKKLKIQLDAEPLPDHLRLRSAEKQNKLKQLFDNNKALASGSFASELNRSYRQYNLTKEVTNQDNRVNDDDIPEGPLYLFNVIVALEWPASRDYLSQLKQAFRQASDYLYDVSNGQMAFAHVVFGGPELMDCADIQIMASNRLYPRSWQEGLFSQEVRPIRVGRGLWNPRLKVTIGWDEPEGYRTLIHEWGHYALGLHDKYLDSYEHKPIDSQQRLIIPMNSLTDYSFMASTSLSEMYNEKNQDIIKKIHYHFPKFDHERKLAGPYHLPLPYPIFHSSIEEITNPRSLGDLFPNQLEALDSTSADAKYDTDSLLYLLQESEDNSTQFKSLLALGTLDRSLITQHSELPNIIDQEQVVGSWLLWQQKTLQNNLLVTVVPLSSDEVEVSIKRNSGPVPRRLQLFSQGKSSSERVIEIKMAEGQSQWRSDPIKVPSLDGHLLLEFTTDQLMIYPFSQGGMGPSHNPVSAPPHTAGSLDGNVMLFFDETNDSSKKESDHKLKIITTLNDAPSGNEHIGSYIYSIASNQPLAKEDNPTLVLYYDTASTGPASGYKHRPILRRLDNDSWLPLETYASYGRPFVAIPLDKKTAPNLIEINPSNNLRIESYQLYWKLMA